MKQQDLFFAFLRAATEVYVEEWGCLAESTLVDLELCTSAFHHAITILAVLKHCKKQHFEIVGLDIWEVMEFLKIDECFDWKFRRYLGVATCRGIHVLGGFIRSVFRVSTNPACQLMTNILGEFIFAERCALKSNYAKMSNAQTDREQNEDWFNRTTNITKAPKNSYSVFFNPDLIIVKKSEESF